MTASLNVRQHDPSSRELLAPPIACTVSQADAERQLERARLLTPHLLKTTRSRTELTLTFAAGADRAALAAFAQTERGCCSFFEQITDATEPDGQMTLHYTGAADGSHELMLAEVARIFDGTADHVDVDPAAFGDSGERRRNVKTTAGVLAALGLACSACLIPGLAVGSAGILAGTAISGERLLLAGGAVALLGYAALARRRRAKAASGSDCGC